MTATTTHGLHDATMEKALATLEDEHLQGGGLLDGVALTFAEAASLAEEYADLATEQDEQAAGYRRRLEAIDVPVAVPAWNPADPDQVDAHVRHLEQMQRNGLAMRSLARAADACVARAGHYRSLTQRLHEHAGRVVTQDVGPSAGAIPGD